MILQFWRKALRAGLHGGGGPQMGEVTCGRSPHLSCKSDLIKMRDYMDRRVTPPKRVTSSTWGPPPPCKQALRTDTSHHGKVIKIGLWVKCCPRCRKLDLEREKMPNTFEKWNKQTVECAGMEKSSKSSVPTQQSPVPIGFSSRLHY